MADPFTPDAWTFKGKNAGNTELIYHWDPNTNTLKYLDGNANPPAWKVASSGDVMSNHDRIKALVVENNKKSGTGVDPNSDEGKLSKAQVDKAVNDAALAGFQKDYWERRANGELIPGSDEAQAHEAKLRALGVEEKQLAAMRDANAEQVRSNLDKSELDWNKHIQTVRDGKLDRELNERLTTLGNDNKIDVQKLQNQGGLATATVSADATKHSANQGLAGTVYSSDTTRQTRLDELAQEAPYTQAQTELTQAQTAEARARMLREDFADKQQQIQDKLKMDIELRKLTMKEALDQYTMWESRERLSYESRLAEIETAEDARANNLTYGRDLAQMAVNASVEQMRYLIPTAQLDADNASMQGDIYNAGRPMGAPMQAVPGVVGGAIGTGATMFNFGPGGNRDPAAMAQHAMAAAGLHVGSGQVKPGALAATGPAPAVPVMAPMIQNTMSVAGPPQVAGPPVEVASAPPGATVINAEAPAPEESDVPYVAPTGPGTWNPFGIRSTA